MVASRIEINDSQYRLFHIIFLNSITKRLELYKLAYMWIYCRWLCLKESPGNYGHLYGWPAAVMREKITQGCWSQQVRCCVLLFCFCGLMKNKNVSIVLAMFSFLNNFWLKRHGFPVMALMLTKAMSFCSDLD